MAIATFASEIGRNYLFHYSWHFILGLYEQDEIKSFKCKYHVIEVKRFNFSWREIILRLRSCSGGPLLFLLMGWSLYGRTIPCSSISISDGLELDLLERELVLSVLYNLTWSSTKAKYHWLFNMQKMLTNGVYRLSILLPILLKGILVVCNNEQYFMTSQLCIYYTRSIFPSIILRVCRPL